MNSRDSALSASPPSSVETPSASVERLCPHATLSGNKSVRGAASKACPDRGDDYLRENCHLDGFQNASSHTTNTSRPTILCGDEGRERLQRVQHQCVLCWDEGCDRQAEAGPMSRDGEIDLFCSDHQTSDVINTRIERCQFPGCLNTPKYGQRKGPLRFCQQHKRPGMYTNRNGRLLVATRGGSAFKYEDDTEAVGAATPTINFAVGKNFQYNVKGDNTTGFGNTGDKPNAPSERKCLQASSEAGPQVSAEPVGLGPGFVQDTATSPTVGIMVATTQYRKMCEVTGCRIQPSYGPSGTTRPRFCASHKQKGMVGLKNRPCLFPGCSTRPHYGFWGCRATYCAKHKEANMIHLLKEATTREKVDVMRDFGETIRTPPEPIRPESKRLLSATCPKEEKVGQKVHKKSGATLQVEDHQPLDSRKGADAASPLPLPPARQRQKRNKGGTGKGGTYCPRKTASSIPSAYSSSTSTSKPAPSKELMASNKPGDPGKCGNVSGASPYLPENTPSSRQADTLYMTPSFEIQIRKDIRKSAQAEATTTNSGKRARLPSRKAMEASGKLKSEGIQWLTKEKKEEEAQRMKEIKAQRKAAAAVGLRAGQVIEAAAIGPTVGGERAGTDGNDVGDIAKSEPAKNMWCKLSPAEILEVTARKSIINEINKTHPRGGGQVASEARGADNHRWGNSAKDIIAGIYGGKRKEAVWTPQSTATAMTPESSTAFPQDAKRRKESFGDQSVYTRKEVPSSDRKETRDFSPWASTGYTGSDEAGEVGRMKVCQFEGCAKKATFGVNGIVRYCKLHAIFGMHRINVPV